MLPNNPNANLVEKRPKIPLGLEKLIEQCLIVYPDQTNPLQVTTCIKYWLGGHDPLDYISMYHNRGDPEKNIHEHWHYISFGLSDLHGDGRVHLPDPALQQSGMGFELTFRLIKDKNEARPPTWPANLLQNLARYVFTSGNRLCAGDNIPWRKSLDNKSSQINSMLLADDPQLPRTETPFGSVDFFQIVGVTSEELDQASRWNGKGVLDLLRRDPSTGGQLLITDMQRARSVFELFPATLERLEMDLQAQGSDLAGVNSEFTFRELPRTKIRSVIDSTLLNEQCLREVNNSSLNLKDFQSLDITNNEAPESQQQQVPFTGSVDMVCPIDSQPISSRALYLDGLELTLPPYAAKFLLLAIKDRVNHGRHFTLKSQHLAVTFVSEDVEAAMASRDSPYVLTGYWLQVLIPNSLKHAMLTAFRTHLNINPETMRTPQVFEFSEHNLKFVIDHLPDNLQQVAPINLL